MSFLCHHPEKGAHTQIHSLVPPPGVQTPTPSIGRSPMVGRNMSKFGSYDSSLYYKYEFLFKSCLLVKCESIVATPDPSFVAICLGTSKGQAWGSLLTVVHHQNYMSTKEKKGDKTEHHHRLRVFTNNFHEFW